MSVAARLQEQSFPSELASLSKTTHKECLTMGI
jgi:hypothetical protein